MRAEIDPAWWTLDSWEGRPICAFLQQRDVSAIFRFLHARGLSYAAIGGLVDLSPSRVAEITKQSRQVSAYDVLERIAIGLQIPRALMGLGCEPALDPAHGGHTPGPGGWVASPDTAAATSHSAVTSFDQLRVQLDEALASASVSPRQLDLIDEAVSDHVRVYPATPPTLMLARIATECGEVLALSRRRQPAAVQARLSGTAALLATMCADALMRLGTVDDARLWYRTALLAADDSGEPGLRVLVRAQAAMLPYYFGDPHQTVSLADAALALSQTPSPSRALAAAGRARALARLGAAEAAREGIRQARRVFDAAGDDDTDAAFRFPAKRLLFYLSGALTWLADTAEAYRVQEEALALYQASSAAIDPVLIHLDRSMCLAADRRPTEAAATARAAVAALPDVQRTEIILTRAQDVVTTVPPDEHRGEITDLADYLHACRVSAHTLSGRPAAVAR